MAKKDADLEKYEFKSDRKAVLTRKVSDSISSGEGAWLAPVPLEKSKFKILQIFKPDTTGSIIDSEFLNRYWLNEEAGEVIRIIVEKLTDEEVEEYIRLKKKEKII